MVRCDDNNLYVLKLSNNLQGSNVLANEWLGAALFAALGANTPKVAHIHLTNAVIARFPLLSMEGRKKNFLPVPGYHFGSRLVGDVTLLERATDRAFGAKPSDVTNLRDFAWAFLFDVWANTTDRREVIFIDNRGGTVTACFIDHGHMFGGPNWDYGVTREHTYLQHYPFYVSALTNEAIKECISKMGNVIPRVFAKVMTTLPRSWYVGNIESMQNFYLGRLNDLRRLMRAPALLHPGSEHFNGALRLV